jgi:hypothetical protein
VLVLGKINAYQRFAIIRSHPRQSEPLGKRPGGFWRDFQAIG